MFELASFFEVAEPFELNFCEKNFNLRKIINLNFVNISCETLILSEN